MSHSFRALTFALAWMLAAVAPVGHAAETLKIATSVPAGTSFIDALQAAGDTIAERTQGRVELKLFPGGVMGSDRGVLRKIRIGQLHGAVITASGLAMIHPDAQVYSLPFLFRNRDEIAWVRKRIDPVIRERVRAEGYEVVGISGGGFTYLFTQEPVPDLEALSNATAWVPQGDEITGRMFERAGSQTVSLPIADVYTSLQTGLVDTVAINPAGAIALQWHTGVSHYTDAPLLYLVAMMVIDRRAFARLEQADQAIVHEELTTTFGRIDKITRADNEEALQALRDRGIEAVEPTRPPGERGWQEIARETLEEMEREGRFDANLLDRVRGLIREYRAGDGD